MKSVMQTAFATIALLLTSVAASAGTYQANVSVIRPGGDRPCTLFQLSGIPQADNILPGSPWFVLESTIVWL